jgi:hypothetical protein
MFVMLNGKVKKWQQIGGKSLLLVSGHQAMGTKCFCDPTFVSWLFLQVLETSPYRGGAAGILDRR